MAEIAGDSCGRDGWYRLLYEQHYEAVVAYARRWVPPFDAEEVAADTFCVAWRRLTDIPPDSALPWLYGVARRVLAVHRRAGVRRERLKCRLAVEITTDRDWVGMRGGALDDLAADAFSRLRRQDQMLLRLAVVDGLSAKEMALLLACSPNAVALRLCRARRRLSAAFGTVLLARTADASRDRPEVDMAQRPARCDVTGHADVDLAQP